MSSSMEQDRMMGGIRNGNLQECKWVQIFQSELVSGQIIDMRYGKIT